MANSYIEYTANGSTTTFSIPFAYTQQADVAVFVGGTSTSFTFSSSSTISLSTAPTSGVVVRIARTTVITTRAVDFSNGAILTEADLDNSNIQVFQAAQEAIDIAASSISKAADGKFDAQSRVIKNVANPVSAQDAATKNWVETAQTSSVNIATTKAAEASSSATNALASKDAAAASLVLTNQDVVLTHADVVLAEADKVQTGLDRAAVAADLVLTNADVVLAEADKVQTALDRIDVTAKASTTTTNAANASTSANNAAASLTSFNGKYVSQANAPTSPVTGALWFDTSASTMKVYNGSAWANAGSSVNGVENAVQHTATAGQTSFSATYDAGHLQVFLNGIRLDTADYTATNGNAVVLAVAAAVGDTVFIQGFGTFVLADVYTKSAADARFEPIDSAYTKSEANGRFKSISASEGGPSLGTNSVIRVNAKVIAENITFNNQNGSSVGPITVNSGYTVTVDSGSTWVII